MIKSNVKYMLGLAVAGMMVVGCGKEEVTPVIPPAAPPAPQTQTPTLPQIDTTAAQKAIDDAKTASANAASETQAKLDTAATDASANVNAMSAETETMAKDMIAKVQAFIKENKLDDADSTLKKLEDMKAKLPQSLQDQIAKLRPMLDSARNMKMPAMPAMPAMGK